MVHTFKIQENKRKQIFRKAQKNSESKKTQKAPAENNSDLAPRQAQPLALGLAQPLALGRISTRHTAAAAAECAHAAPCRRSLQPRRRRPAPGPCSRRSTAPEATHPPALQASQRSAAAALHHRQTLQPRRRWRQLAPRRRRWRQLAPCPRLRRSAARRQPPNQKEVC